MTLSRNLFPSHIQTLMNANVAVNSVPECTQLGLKAFLMPHSGSASPETAAIMGFSYILLDQPPHPCCVLIG